MDPKIRELNDRLIELNEAAQTIQATADSESRDLTEDEEKEISAIFAEFKRTEDEIERRELLDEQTNKLMKSQGRKVEPQEPDAPEAHPRAQNNNSARQPQPPRQSTQRPSVRFTPESGRWGFRDLGEFASCVVRAAIPGGSGVIDPRLVRNAPTTYGTEGIGADGGFAVPPEFRREIFQKVMGEESLFSRTDSNAISGNTMVLPADDTTPWDASGGIQVYWSQEAAQITQSKPALTQRTISLDKLVALVQLTEELIQDAPALAAYVNKKTAEKFDFAINKAIVQGTGAGQPLGILTHTDSLVSVAQESGQSADTIVVENIINIYSRMYADSRPRAVWLINQDIEPQLYTLQLYAKDASGTVVSGTPVYMPPGGLSQAPYGTLFGRPVIPTQACETLGDKGDIIFVDLSQYLTLYKTEGIRNDISMHLWFDYDVLALKFVLRIAGQPWWKTSITPRDSSNTLSWAVTLDERAG